MRSGSTAKVLAKCNLKFYTVSECAAIKVSDRQMAGKASDTGQALSNAPGLVLMRTDIEILGRDATWTRHLRS